MRDEAAVGLNIRREAQSVAHTVFAVIINSARLLIASIMHVPYNSS